MGYNAKFGNYALDSSTTWQNEEARNNEETIQTQLKEDVKEPESETRDKTVMEGNDNGKTCHEIKQMEDLPSVSKEDKQENSHPQENGSRALEETEETHLWEMEEDVLGFLKAVAFYGCMSPPAPSAPSIKLLDDILLVTNSIYQVCKCSYSNYCLCGRNRP